MKKIYYKLEREDKNEFEKFKDEYMVHIKNELNANITSKLTDNEIKKFLFGNPEDIIMEVKNGSLPNTTELKYEFISKSPKVGEYNNYRDKILSMFGITVCAYCNRNYYFIYNDIKVGKKYRAMFDLDHFYPKTHYGYLSLNIYNFVPACGNCNTFKSSKTDAIINPHIESFDEYVKFELNHNSVESIIGLNDDFEIELNIKTTDGAINNKCKNTINMFKLKKIYNIHKKDVKKILLKNQAYSDELKKDLEIIISGQDNIVLPDITVDEFIYNTSNDINNTAISKFTNDILEFVNTNYKNSK